MSNSVQDRDARSLALAVICLAFTGFLLALALVTSVLSNSVSTPANPVYVCREHNAYLVADGVVVNLERSCKIIAEGTLQ